MICACSFCHLPKVALEGLVGGAMCLWGHDRLVAFDRVLLSHGVGPVAGCVGVCDVLRQVRLCRTTQSCASFDVMTVLHEVLLGNSKRG